MEKYISLCQKEETVEYDENTTYEEFLTTIGEKFNLKENSFYVKGLSDENFEENFFQQDYFEIERSEYDKAKERLNWKNNFKYIKTLQEAEDYLTVYGYKDDTSDWIHIKTPLLIAVEDDNIEIVKLILSKNFPDVNRSDNEGRTPLFSAVEKGNTEMVKLLLEQNFPNAHRADENGQTPLYIATYRGHKEIVELILEQNFPNAHMADKKGMTPLLYATYFNNKDILNLLKQNINRYN